VTDRQETPLIPLTPEAFAPFGVVVSHAGSERRHFLDLDVACAGAGIRLATWVTLIDRPAVAGSQIEQLERHPHSDQVFVPLSGQRFLVIACGSDAEGEPDLDSVRGFVAGPGQGVIFKRNVWHAGMQVLDTPAQFFVQMKFTADGGDDEFRPIARPIRLPAFSVGATGSERGTP
jgi:ureidoglycolate lyase